MQINKQHWLNDLLNEAHSLGASDIHLSPNKPPIFRIAGRLRSMNHFENISPEGIQTWFTDQLPQHRIQENQQINFAFNHSDTDQRVRVTVYQTTSGTSLALRLLSKLPPAPEVLRQPKFLSQISPFAKGLVLVTGPTGSGKSTTLASWLNAAQMQHPAHFVTIEDPIEYEFPQGQGLVHQCELGAHFTNHESALSDVLRRDPDVILLGELRDLASIELALRFAETGHLVLATLHSANATDAILRVVDVFPSTSRDFVRHVLSNVLLGVVAQRLLTCQTATAHQGRIANYEVLTNTSAVKNLIKEQKEAQLNSVMQTSATHHMMTFEQHQQELVSSGLLPR